MAAITAAIYQEAQSSDLSSRRAELIKTTDGRKHSRLQVNLDMVEQSRDCNLVGTRAYELAQKNAEMMKAWRECVPPVEGEREEVAVGIGHGNSHRHNQVLRKLGMEAVEDSNRLRLGAGDARGHSTSLMSRWEPQHSNTMQSRKREAAESMSQDTYDSHDNLDTTQLKPKKKRSKSRARRGLVPNSTIALEAPVSVKRMKLNNNNPAWSAANLATPDTLEVAVTQDGTLSATVRAETDLVDQIASARAAVREKARRVQVTSMSTRAATWLDQHRISDGGRDYTNPPEDLLCGLSHVEKPLLPALKPHVSVSVGNASAQNVQQAIGVPQPSLVSTAKDIKDFAETVNHENKTVETAAPDPGSAVTRLVVSTSTAPSHSFPTGQLPPRPAARVRSQFSTPVASEALNPSRSTAQSEQHFKPPTNVRPIQPVGPRNTSSVISRSHAVSLSVDSATEEQPNNTYLESSSAKHARRASGVSDLTRNMASLRVENQTEPTCMPKIDAGPVKSAVSTSNVSPTLQGQPSIVSVRQCQELSDGSLVVDGKKYVPAAIDKNVDSRTTAIGRNGETSIVSPPPTPKIMAGFLLQSKYADPTVFSVALERIARGPTQQPRSTLPTARPFGAMFTPTFSQSVSRPTTSHHIPRSVVRDNLAEAVGAETQSKSQSQSQKSVIGNDLTASKWASR